MNNAYSIVDQFEKRVAEFAGSDYAIAVDSGTSAIKLSFALIGIKNIGIEVPKKTYVSVPMCIIQLGGRVFFVDKTWQGAYDMDVTIPMDPCAEWTVVDGAKRFTRNMYAYGFHCLSFHAKKHINIGRGGMILTNSLEVSEELKELRYDGRWQVPYGYSAITRVGYNAYMTPEQAARGLMLMDVMPKDGFDDLIEDYPDLTDERLFPVFKDHPQVVK